MVGGMGIPQFEDLWSYHILKTLTFALHYILINILFKIKIYFFFSRYTYIPSLE